VKLVFEFHVFGWDQDFVGALEEQFMMKILVFDKE
jgi:hypothetical protein